MRQLLTDRYRERVAGVISCYDRICYAKGMTAFLSARQIRIFDYPRFAEPLRDRVRERAAELARAAGITIDYHRTYCQEPYPEGGRRRFQKSVEAAA